MAVGMNSFPGPQFPSPEKAVPKQKHEETSFLKDRIFLGKERADDISYLEK